MLKSRQLHGELLNILRFVYCACKNYFESLILPTFKVRPMLWHG